MARDINGKNIKVQTGTREVNPDAKANRWKGAVTFPNGSVYFPTGDYFILPNGYKILNGPNAKSQIEEYLKKPKAPGGGIQYPPGQGPRPNNPIKGGPPGGGVGDPVGNPKGQPGQPPPGSEPPIPGGGGGVDPTGPQGLGTGGNFAKGQPRYGQDPGGEFMPFLEQFYGNQGFYPWIDSFPQGTGSGNNPYAGQGGGGWGPGPGFGSMGGSPQYYDPLGIGATGDNFYANYMDDNADFYPMVGANSVTGYDGMQPRFGIVGGQGGYGIGMVGPEYSGPLWNSYPDLNLLQQQQMLTTPTTAQQSPDALPAPQQTTNNTASNTTNSSNNGSSNVNPPKGQPAQQQAQGQQQLAPGQPAAGWAWNGAKWISPSEPAPPGMKWSGGTLVPALSGQPGSQYTDQFGNVVSEADYANQQKNWQTNGMNSVLQPGAFTSPYGDLVQVSGGNQYLYKRNGASEADGMYYYDPAASKWNQMSLDQYRSTGGSMDWSKYNPYSSVSTAQAAGAKNANYWNQNSQPTSQWSPGGPIRQTDPSKVRRGGGRTGGIA